MMGSRNHSAAGGLVIGSLTAAAGAFVVNILSARMLGPELRGSVALVLQLSYFISPFLLLGAEKRILRSGRDASPKDAPPYNSILIVALMATPACFIAAGLGGLLAVPISIVAVMFAYARSWHVARGTIRSYVIPFVCYQASVVIGSFALFFRGVSLWEAWAAVYILPGVFIAVWNVRKLLWRSRKPLAGLWSTLRGNGNYMLASVSVIATTRFERLLLPIVANPRELGLYIVVATASEPLFWFAQALSDIRVGAGKAGAFSGRAFAIDILLFSSVGAIGGVAISYLLVPVFGEEYEDSRGLIGPLILASIILALYRQLSGKVLLGRSSRAFAVSEVVTGIQAVLVYTSFLLLFPSALGAAWGSVAVYSMAIVILALFGFRKVST